MAEKIPHTLYESEGGTKDFFVAAESRTLEHAGRVLEDLLSATATPKWKQTLVLDCQKNLLPELEKMRDNKNLSIPKKQQVDTVINKLQTVIYSLQHKT